MAFLGEHQWSRRLVIMTNARIDDHRPGSSHRAPGRYRPASRSTAPATPAAVRASLAGGQPPDRQALPASSRTPQSRQAHRPPRPSRPNCLLVPCARCAAPTTERSDWNWAKDCSRRVRARPARRRHQVHCHVVGRGEGGSQRIGTTRGQPSDRPWIQAGLPEHDRVTLDIDPAPPRATGQVVYSPGVTSAGFAVELHQLLQHHRPGRHVDAQCQRLGGEDNLDQPADEGLLDALLGTRSMPA